jgi:hypothetical protein
MPYSIVRSTEFFELFKRIADEATEGSKVRVPPVLFQPIAAADVANVVTGVAEGAPLNGIREVAGPQRFQLDEFIRVGLAARRDPRLVVADPQARYFGAALDEGALVPAAGAGLGEIRFADWLAQSAILAARA